MSTNSLSAASLVLVTALVTVEHDREKHVPGVKTGPEAETFAVPEHVRDSLIKAGAVKDAEVVDADALLSQVDTTLTGGNTASALVTSFADVADMVEADKLRSDLVEAIAARDGLSQQLQEAAAAHGNLSEQLSEVQEQLAQSQEQLAQSQEQLATANASLAELQNKAAEGAGDAGNAAGDAADAAGDGAGAGDASANGDAAAAGQQDKAAATTTRRKAG